MNRLLYLFLLVLPLPIGCGGGGGGSQSPLAPAPTAMATRVLHYTNPQAQGFRLEVDPATNGTAHLVLQLRGPEGLPVGGAAFFLEVQGDQASWAHPAGSSAYFREGGALGAGPHPLARARVRGSVLEVGLFTKGGAPAPLSKAPLLSVALDVKPGAAPGPVSLATPSGKGAVYLDGQRLVAPLPGALGVGTLEVK